MADPIIWPDFKGRGGNPEVEVIDLTHVHESVDGHETTLSIYDQPRYRYTFNLVGLRKTRPAPAPWAAYSEVDALLQMLFQARGRRNRFTVTDPLTGNPILCRLDSDVSKVQQVDKTHWWTAKVVFISVRV